MNGVVLQKLFYPVEESAELLAQGRTKTFEAIKSGKLRSVKVGGRRLVPADALLEYAELLSTTSAAA